MNKIIENNIKMIAIFNTKFELIKYSTKTLIYFYSSHRKLMKYLFLPIIDFNKENIYPVFSNTKLINQKTLEVVNETVFLNLANYFKLIIRFAELKIKFIIGRN